MKRKFTKLMAALALLVFTMPSLVAWGQTRDTKTEGFETASAGSTYNSTQTYNATQSDCGIGWTMYYGTVSTNAKISGTNSAQMRWYSTATSNYPYIYTTTAIDGLSNVSFKAKVGNTNVKMDVLYSADGTTWTSVITGVTMTTTVTTYSYTIPSGGKYIKIGVSQSSTAPSSGNYNFVVDDVVFTYSSSGTQLVSTPVITPDSRPFLDTQEVAISCATDGATIYYTTNGSTPTISNTVYSEPFTIDATTTVKALAVKTGMDNSEIATAEFTKVTPMSVADAIAAITAAGSNIPIENQCVTGIVCTASSNIYSGKLSYYISDDGTTTNRLEAYNGLGLYGEAFTSVNDVQVGDVVVIYGDLTKYNSTYEFAAGNYLLSLVRPVVPVIDATAGEALAYNATEGSIVYEITNYVEGTMTATTNAEWITNIAVEEVDDMGEVTFNVTTNNTGEVRTGVVTLTFTYDTDKTVTADVTVSQAALVLPVINAEDVNINFTATSGNIAYTIDNAIDGTTLTASVPSGSWLTLGDITATEVPFTCEANNGEARTETVTLTYGDITKDVTVTQAAYADIYTGEGTFNKVTALTDLEDGGYYVLTYDNHALKASYYGNTTNEMASEPITPNSNNEVIDPSTDIVWKLEKNGDNWNLYNDEIGKYCCIIGNSTTAFSLVEEATVSYTVSLSNEAFIFATTATGGRCISYYSANSSFRSYASSNATTKLTLYKLGEASQDPYFTVEDVTIEYNAETGSISYTVNNPVDGGSVTAEVTDGDWLTLGSGTASPISFTCSANTDYTSREASVTLTYTYNNSKPAVTATVTVTQGAAPYPSVTYTLATSIESGRHYIIVGNDGDNAFAMGNDKGSNRNAAGITINNNTATVSSVDVYEFVINGPDAEGHYTIYDAKWASTNGGYLYASSGSSNQLKTRQFNTDGNSQWSIAFDEENNATITANGNNSRNLMRFNPNNGSPIFACYASTSTTGSLPYLYVKDETTPTYAFYKDVVGYGSNEGGYVLIATPTATDAVPATVGMITDDGTDPENYTYDLYYFDQTGGGENGDGKEWRNYRAQSFELTSGKGYLYANKSNVTLAFTGTPNTVNGQVSVAAGWNLVGNPFSVAATPNQPYYRLNAEGGELNAETETGAVNAMEGVFVNAAEAGNVTFSAGTSKGQNVALNVMKNCGNVIDRAIVRFDEGDKLPKFQLFENSTKLYIPQGNQDFAIVRSANQGEMPVSFRASEDGTYTLAVETENVEMNYLHLIDNMTGMDVDLLQTPSYTFEAKTSDYASRFRLVFKASSTSSEADETFAYFNGSSWTVSNLGEATLQVVDVTGRTVANQMINGNAELNLNQPAGVYVIRLVNGNSVKVQKVVVR